MSYIKEGRIFFNVFFFIEVFFFYCYLIFRFDLIFFIRFYLNGEVKVMYHWKILLCYFFEIILGSLLEKLV